MISSAPNARCVIAIPPNQASSLCQMPSKFEKSFSTATPLTKQTKLNIKDDGKLPPIKLCLEF